VIVGEIIEAILTSEHKGGWWTFIIIVALLGVSYAVWYYTGWNIF